MNTELNTELKITFELGNIGEMENYFQKARESFPFISIAEYFTNPHKTLAPFINDSSHVLAFRFKLLPDSPDRVWYMIKTGEVARKVFNAPRYGNQASGHPWGEGPHTAILRSALAVDKSYGAGTNNVMTTGADKHEEFRKPLREELIKGLDCYIPMMAKCVDAILQEKTIGKVLDINSFSRDLVQKTVLTLIGLPVDTVTMDDISKLNSLAHEIAKKVEGATDRMRSLRENIDLRVVKGMPLIKEGTLFKALQKKGYTEVACRETIVALMIGARNGSTALIHLIWMLSRNSEMQKTALEEFSLVHQGNDDWTQSLKQLHLLQNLFRYSLLMHSPVSTMNRNAINPMVLTIADNDGENRYGVFAGDRVDYLMYEAAKMDKPDYKNEEKIPLPHLPFGVGPNQCPASHLIEVICVMTAGMLVSRFQLDSDKEKLNVIPNVFVSEFVDESVEIRMEKRNNKI